MPVPHDTPPPPAATDCAAPPALGGDEHRRLAAVLRAAERERRGVEPLSARHPELTAGDGCRVRDIVLADRVADGERLVGAVASYGRDWDLRISWVTDAMLLTSGLATLDELIEPRVEPRLALRLARPLRAPVTTVGQVVAAARGLRLCLEVIDSRYAGAGVTVADELADNYGTARLYVVGETAAPGAEALADGSIHALVMLAAKLARRQGVLEPGTLLVAPLHAT